MGKFSFAICRNKLHFKMYSNRKSQITSVITITYYSVLKCIIIV